MRKRDGEFFSDASAAAFAPPAGARRVVLPDGAAFAALAETVRRDPDVPCVLCVLPDARSFERFAADAAAFARRGSNVRSFPMMFEAKTDPEAVASRLSILSALGARERSPQMLLAASVQALLQPSPDPKKTDALARMLATGASCDPEEFAAWLEHGGYKAAPEVYERGTWARKGGIVDVWPTGAAVPTRIEFFGDEICSLRTFDPATQRSDRTIESLRVLPARIPEHSKLLLHEALPDGSVVLWFDPERVADEAFAFAESGAIGEKRRLPAILDALSKRGAVRCIDVAIGANGTEDFAPPVRSAEGLADGGAASVDPEIMAMRRRELLEIARTAAGGKIERLHFCFDTRGALEHARRELTEFFGGDGPDMRVAPISRGFVIADARGRTKAAYFSQADLYGFGKSVAAPARGTDFDEESDGTEDLVPSEDPAEALASRIVDNIEPGDIVVHVDHGIGRYLGTKVIVTGGKPTETLVLEYAGGAKLYVPLAHANKVSRYAGVGDVPVRLNSLTGTKWNATKQKAALAVRDLAAGMLLRQARRKQLPGHAFDPDTPYYAEFEASFPYQETPGQAECLRKVMADMQSPHPMDRLVCGDAGYGKTEIALRAAFVAAMQGKQVALLVPTTVLAQQHYELFRRRLAPYPLRVELHSRFVTQAQRRATAAAAARGTADIVIGTHGILAKDFRFKDLGLLIVDEEQRFGVMAKERLKEASEMVDVLTLSATPIPRTLYLGLMGARDLSILRTPPAGRVAVETIITEDTDETITAAVLREVERGGQVFFLHNRVMTIRIVEERLRRLFPHLRIAVGHGQLQPRETERIMRDFADGLYDVLLSTTIVENGIDVPRANTIIIDRADRFGIADLYQLRGRVGRGKTRARAYFLLPNGAPMTSDARTRLEALRAGSKLGAGVSLALRDLSIRGSGNLLGAEQSGHISAVGFSLYCQLLRRAVASLKGEPPPLLVNVEMTLPFIAQGPGDAVDGNVASACLPQSFIDDPMRRIEFHRRLAECSSEREVDALRCEIEDRFGASPKELVRLYDCTRCRILAAERGITRIDTSDGWLCLYRNGVPLRVGSKLPRPHGATPDDKLASVLRILRNVSNGAIAAPPEPKPKPEKPRFRRPDSW